MNNFQDPDIQKLVENTMKPDYSKLGQSPPQIKEETNKIGQSIDDLNKQVVTVVENPKISDKEKIDALLIIHHSLVSIVKSALLMQMLQQEDSTEVVEEQSEEGGVYNGQYQTKNTSILRTRSISSDYDVSTCEIIRHRIRYSLRQII
eukprot:TRINITY_DN30291_c0_g3_i2.p3 TRINITY_DN30291_c0_g3~~TRINITY_DN30291_c0_g3_i2.p3  ORF type:complete len:148 (+),score=3.91 TRINITY_DN30291_c0_g3_i2:585-1028(+)